MNSVIEENIKTVQTVNTSNYVMVVADCFINKFNTFIYLDIENN